MLKIIWKAVQSAKLNDEHRNWVNLELSAAEFHFIISSIQSRLLVFTIYKSLHKIVSSKNNVLYNWSLYLLLYKFETWTTYSTYKTL